MLATRTRTTNARLPTTLTSRRPSRRRLNYEAGIKPGTVQTARTACRAEWTSVHSVISRLNPILQK